MNNFSRRNFLTALGVAAGTTILPAAVNAKTQNNKYNGGLVTGKLKALPYKSIPGFLSAEQISPHHKAHYGGALRGYVSIDAKLHSKTKMDSVKYGAMQRTVANKSNSVILHELYFDGMTAKTSNPDHEIKAAIIKRFGSIDRWAEDFQASAKTASGWAMLAYNQLNGKLNNVVCDKHATGVLWMSTPLVVIDTYEHAFYVDYKNNKKEYIKRFMNHINWKESNNRFKQV